MSKIIIIILLILLGINVVYSASGVRSYPLNSVDVYGIWMFKAKAWYLHQALPLAELTNPSFSYSHPQYPLLLPYIFYRLFRLFGSVWEVGALSIYPVIYTCILIISYLSLRGLKFSQNQSLFFTYIYSMLSPLLAQAGRKHAGNADIILCLAYWIGLYLIIRWSQRYPVRLGFGLSLLSVLASQIKIEGLFLVILLWFIPVKLWQKVFWTVVSVLPALSWWILQKHLGIVPDFFVFLPSPVILASRVFIVATGLVKEMFNWRNWYVFWPLFWLIYLLPSVALPYTYQVFKNALLIICLLFLFNYLFSTYPTDAYVSSTLDRLMLQLSPFYFQIFAAKTKAVFTGRS